MPDEQHAHRGGLSRDQLAALVEAGLTQREIAAEVGRSQATVRWWLERYGLRTLRGGGRRRGSSRCATHPDAEHFVDSRGTLRCRVCAAARVAQRRRRVKEILVAEAGGCCRLCGYAKSVVALQFHHVDPSTKAFAISRKGITRSIDAMRDEAAKCVLLCANCHAEVEAGVSRLPSAAPEEVRRQPPNPPDIRG